MILPTILWLILPGKHGKRRKLLIPLFLIWPIALVVVLFIYVVYLLFFWIWIWFPDRWWLFKAGYRFYILFCAMRGTVVEVTNRNEALAFKVE